MVKQKYGRIINTTSGTGLFGTKNNHHYAASKGAVAGFTRSLSIDSGQHGVVVNAVAPMAATRLANNIGSSPIMVGNHSRIPAGYS